MNEFKEIISELIFLFQNLCQIEQEKLNVIQKNRITFLEDCMNQEQAAILKMRGLDVRRENCQDRLGWKGDSFRQILDKLDEDGRAEFEPMFDELSRFVSLFQEISDSARSLIEVNLHQINKMMESGVQSGSPASSATFTSKKI